MADWRELQNRLRSRGASDECPICRDTKWMPGSPSVGLAIVDDRQRYVDFSVARGLICSAFLCANCGYVRLHVPDVLDDPRLFEEAGAGEAGPVTDEDDTPTAEET